MSRFGLAPIKKAGAPGHPDMYDNSDELSDEQYRRQMEAYAAATGDHEAKKHCVRDYLF